MTTFTKRVRRVLMPVFLFVVVSSITPTVAAGQSFAFQPRSVTKTEGRCEEPAAPCAAITLSYPEYTSAPTDRARETINKYIRDILLMLPFGEPKPATSLDEVASRFIAAYKEARQELPDMPARWSHDTKVSVLYQ